MEEIDHEYTDEVVCPHCGLEASDSWEFLDWVDEHECGACGKLYTIERNIRITYTTTKIEGE